MMQIRLKYENYNAKFMYAFYIHQPPSSWRISRRSFLLAPRESPSTQMIHWPLLSSISGHVSEDLVAAITQLDEQGDGRSAMLNSDNIFLIPKKPNAEVVGDFHAMAHP